MKTLVRQVCAQFNAKNAKRAAMLAVAVGAGALSAHATVPADISGAVSDATSVFDSIKTYKLGVFVFTVLLAIAWKMKSR